MTENLAGRGEGLAGLADRISERVAALLDPEQLATLGKGGRVPSSTLRYNVRKAKLGVAQIVKDEIAALEAAAPAGMARPPRTVGCTADAECIHECPVSEPESRLDEFKTTVIALWDPELTPEQKKAYIASRGKELRDAAALATPSPQAPPEQCNAFSPTSARAVREAARKAIEAWMDLDAGQFHEEGKLFKRVDDAIVELFAEPAGSGATNLQATKDETRGDVCEGNAPRLLAESPSNFALTVGNVTGVLFNAGVGLTAPVAAKVTAELNAIAGSPRKVGEDGAHNELSLVRLVLSAHQTAYARFHNGEGRGVIEADQMAIGYASVEIAKALRSSSVPVGEQKQEEGV